ncbi:VOC family protein [Hymenobacter norwichensis]|uniref:VOC family protein n=1 Tax=Hymenobacter norwichensis TaxID=223903 RepID=UPI0003B65129|nr:VOC family protein [Hymenobacter norwichensis]
MKRVAFLFLLFISFGLLPTAAQAQQPTLTFNHAAICVKDLKASTDFYKLVLALPEIPNPFNDGRHTWLSIGPQLQMHIIQGTCTLTPEKNVHLCFSTASVPEFAKRLDRQKVAYSNLLGQQSQVTLRADGVRQLYLQDPDGYWIEINDAK